MNPIGTFHCNEKYPYDAARQGVLADNVGEIRLERKYVQGLRDIQGFSHIWVLYVFNQTLKNSKVKLVVSPPRGTKRVGVFASRSPHRPNPIGLSLVRLVEVKGTRLVIGGHDLLDGTPILDIKPYLPYSDSVEGARYGWVEEAEREGEWSVTWTPRAVEQVSWLERNGVPALRGFIERELGWRPLDDSRKRVSKTETFDTWILAYRTWRVAFREVEKNIVEVLGIFSGYRQEEFDDGTDVYGDKDIHRTFIMGVNAHHRTGF